MSLDDALSHLLEAATPVAETESVPTLDAAGRVLAEPLVSAINVPAADKSERDGWAIRVRDLTEAHLAHSAPRFLPVSQRIPAGQPALPLAVGTVARIFTGADLPDGADAIVMQEDAAESDLGVSFPDIPTAGQWIRRAGEDIRAGSVVLPAGSRLTPQAAGLAASVGAATLSVRRRLRVACFFTGEELVAPGQALAPGAIYESNRFVLINLLRNLGCEVEDLGLIPDTLDATRSTLREAARGADLIVSSGGMSVGEEDHVKPAVQAEGKLALWQVAMKPGKPLAFGAVRRPDGTGSAHFIGLPGNPVSSLVTFLIAVRPLILRLQGVADVTPRTLVLEAHFDWPRPDRRREFLRTSIDAEGGLVLFPNQGPAVLTSAVVSDGLVDCPAGHAIAYGDRVRFLPFSALLH
jgi:molybdopterin molybdotransferase